MDKKNIVTPKGVLVFPHLKSPDTKFDENGVWKTGLRLAGAEAQKLIAIIDKEIDESVTEASEKKSNVKRGAPPYKKDEDSEAFIFNFKLKASGVRPNGEKWKQKPVLYDAKGNVFQSNGKTIWGGTKAKVAFQMSPYFVSSIGAGVSLRLKAVQIIELVTGGADASSYGFQEEEGFVAENETKEETPEEGDF